MAQIQEKLCPSCGRVLPSSASRCTCGHQFTGQSNLAQPATAPTPTPPINPQPSSVPSGGYDELADLARRYRERDSLFWWTLFCGLICWPVLIATYYHAEKKRGIQDRVAQLGVDITWWKLNCVTTPASRASAAWGAAILALIGAAVIFAAYKLIY